MQNIRLIVVALVVEMAIFLNIERLDFQQQNVINIPSFVYVLCCAVIILVLTVPFLWRRSFAFLFTSTLLLYLCLGIVVGTHQLFGSFYTYLTFVEVFFLTLSLWLAYQLAQQLQDFVTAVESMTFSDTTRRIQPLHQAQEDVITEMHRSRRYQRALSIAVLRPDPKTVRLQLNRVVQEVQRTMMLRYAFVSLAHHVSRDTRRPDILLTDVENGNLVLLAPETDRTGMEKAVQRLSRRIHELLGISIDAGIASFPNEALTFEELLAKANNQAKRATSDWIPDDTQPDTNSESADPSIYSQPSATEPADYIQRNGKGN